jgi:hypothetical protein
MTHRLIWILTAGLVLAPIACTTEGNNNTGSTDTDSETAEEDTDPGDGDGDPGDGDGDPGDGDGDGDPSTGDGDGDPTAGTGDFAAVHQLLVDQGCTAGYCHGANANGLTMTDAATSYMNLVGVAATDAVCGLTQRVVPGEPEQSIMWMRVRPAALDGGMACAMKMPSGSDDGLTEADAQIIYDWIAAGALP